MKFYLIDDDKNVLHILKRIIRDRGLGEIAGTAENGVDACLLYTSQGRK